jgi:hypothetical protein
MKHLLTGRFRRTRATLLDKIDGDIEHWLTDEGEPAVYPTHNTAENALREPVVLRKIIGTLWTDREMYVHVTILSLLMPGRQQGRNPTKNSSESFETTRGPHALAPCLPLSPRAKHVIPDDAEQIPPGRRILAPPWERND